MQIIRDDSPQIRSGFAQAEGVVTCGLTGKRQTLALNLTGTNTTKGPIAAVGQAILDGNGNVSGRITISLDGSLATLSITGTYTENADCTGTMQVTPSGLSTSLFNTVRVNGGKELLLIETDPNTITPGIAQQ